MIVFILCALPAGAATSEVGPEAMTKGHWLPTTCEAQQTVGMHQYPEGASDVYMPAVFNEQRFDLRENRLFMRHLLGERGEAGVDDAGGGPAEAPETARLYVTMASTDGIETEFECRPVRGTADNRGYSCVNNPPSEMLLINPERSRYTRSSIGGWAFYAPEASLFVEYGTCRQQSSPRSASDGRR